MIQLAWRFVSFYMEIAYVAVLLDHHGTAESCVSGLRVSPRRSYLGIVFPCMNHFKIQVERLFLSLKSRTESSVTNYVAR